MLYKQKPARVIGLVGEKIELETRTGTVRVRPKDLVFLHPGPVNHLSALQALSGDPAELWSLVEGETFSLAELAELAFGTFTPESALGIWNWLEDGVYFAGTPEAVSPKPKEAIEAVLIARQKRIDEARAWEEFIAALKQGKVTDARQLSDVEALALGRTEKSRVLAALGRPETSAEAHALLLKWKVWDETRLPYAERSKVSTSVVELPVPSLPEENRLDLTHLRALAIDDEGSNDPDDALSLERTAQGYRLWVHVADAAALALPDSDLDLEARRRGATLYLPDRIVPMLPPAMTDLLGLGLNEISPALSFALDLTESFEPIHAEVHLTWVKVERLTYAEADQRLDDPLLADLDRLARAARNRREEAGAVFLELPEVRVRVDQVGGIKVTPLPNLASRSWVSEAMMLAGWGAAFWATERDLALPFAVQDPPLSRVSGEDLPSQWAKRKTLSRTRFVPVSGKHAGLGLDAYAQATSPLRRYLDLVVHQQIRAELLGQTPLSGRDLAARMAEANLAAGDIRFVERSSNKHWTLVFLNRQSVWQGQGIVVERRGSAAIILLPELALDVSLSITQLPGEEVKLEFVEADLSTLDARFRTIV